MKNLTAEINAKTQSRQDAEKIENTPKNFASWRLCVFALISVGYAHTVITGELKNQTFEVFWVYFKRNT